MWLKSKFFSVEGCNESNSLTSSWLWCIMTEPPRRAIFSAGQTNNITRSVTQFRVTRSCIREMPPCGQTSTVQSLRSDSQAWALYNNMKRLAVPAVCIKNPPPRMLSRTVHIIGTTVGLDAGHQNCSWTRVSRCSWTKLQQANTCMRSPETARNSY